MKRRYLLVSQAILIALLFVSLLGSTLLLPKVQDLADAGNKEALKEKVAADWTYMVYCDADNNLDSYGIGDINEMEQGYSNAYNGIVNVIAFIDREYSGATTYKIVQDTGGGIASTVLTTGFPAEPNMGSQTTLTNFITYVFNNFPASNYVLDLWDHGGAIFGICWDDSNGNDKLTFDEVDAAIATACVAAGETIDILALDACLMQLLEMDYEVREYVDFVVASEETIPGYGFPYHTMIGSLCVASRPTPEAYATDMVNDYNSFYSSAYDVTLSSVDVRSTSINNLMAAFNNFTTQLNLRIGIEKSAISAARAATQEFYYDIVVDLYDFAREVKSRVTDAALQDACDWLMGNISVSVINEFEHNNPQAEGIAIYFPDNAGDWESWYATTIDLAQETAWDTFLSNFLFGPTYDLILDSYSFNDSVVDSGETINVSITIRNTGSEDATNVNGTLSCADGNITIVTGFQDYGAITAGSTQTRGNFQFTVNASALNDTVIFFNFLIQAMYTSTPFAKNETFSTIIGSTTAIAGDSFENAALISPSIIDGQMPGPDPTDGSAWYKISVQAGKYLVTSITDSSSDFDIYIYSPSGMLLSAAITTGYPDECSSYIPETGFYVIRVYPYDGSGAYHLTVSISDTPGAEDGLSYGTAISLTPSDPDDTNTLQSTSDIRWYRVWLTQGQSITAWLRGDSGQHDFDLYLYDRLLSELDYSWEYTYPEQIDWTAQYTGYHYLIVIPWSGTGTFTIEVDFGTGGPEIGNSWLTLMAIIVVLGVIVGIFYRFKKKH